MDNFNVHNENTPQPLKGKTHKTLWTLLLAAVIALACGYLSAYLANSQMDEKVVLQKVDTSGPWCTYTMLNIFVKKKQNFT